VPYQLALLSSRLSLALEVVCKRKFDISRTEWRVLALVGQSDECAASDLVERSVMDAVAVHRAVKRLEALGYLCRSESQHDLRVRPLSLTPAGREVYGTVIPYAIELEEQLLGSLPRAKAQQFRETLAQLAAQGEDFGLLEDEQ
jgi:DNA-binding MarR family transcriptional regulator